MSDDTFHQFEEEFHAIAGALAYKINSLPNVENPASLVREAEDDVADAHKCLAKIEAEVKHYPYNQKSRADTRLKQLKAELNELVQKFRAIKDGAEASRHGPGQSRADRQAWKEQRKRLLGANNMQDETSASLERTQQALEETTASGITTTQVLIEQREAIIRSRDTIRETDDLLTRSTKTLRRMRRRLVTNKLLTGVIVLVEVAIIALIVYLRWYR